jgi:hypothetical protein
LQHSARKPARITIDSTLRLRRLPRSFVRPLQVRAGILLFRTGTAQARTGTGKSSKGLRSCSQ